MLQIVTKMYFREDAPLHSTVHRSVLYTNVWFLDREVIELPVGELAPSTASEMVNSLTVSIMEHLEATLPDGSDSPVIAVGQQALPESLADVLAFVLDAVVSLDGGLVRRLIPGSPAQAQHEELSRIFRRTFEPRRLVRDEELADLRRFMERLLALRRGHFERVMRAIRRIVRATQRAVDDPTVAYVDFVTALEALSAGSEGATLGWDRLDGRKRTLIDTALKGVDDDAAGRVRGAVLEAERAGAKHRFVTFVLEHVSPAFFRHEASEAVGPVRGADLERALKTAYDVRSSNVHVLEELPVEAWAMRGGAETAAPPEWGTILTLEGLRRLSRHVIGAYVDRAPTELDREFDWRARLPGQYRARWAPHYWIWQGDGLDHTSADRYFSGFVSNVLDICGGQEDAAVDITPTLERIEQLLPATADSDAKDFMAAVYAIWHGIVAERWRRPGYEAVIAANRGLLERPSVPAFVVASVTGLATGAQAGPEWDADTWKRLADDRRMQRARRRHLELPSGVDALLQVVAADVLLRAGRRDEALQVAAHAVEEGPGDQQLMGWEAGLAAGEPPTLDLLLLLTGVAQPEPGEGEQEEPAEAV